MDDIYTDDEDLWDVPEVPVPGDDGAVGAAAEADDAGDAVADESSELAFDADALDAKLLRHFSGKIVRKDLTSLMKRSANVPTFVLEYLLGMYCSTDDEEGVEEGLERIRKILTENYVRPDESERIKSKIRELGQYTIIDKLSARLDEYKDIYVASFANLTIEPFVIPAEYVRNYSKILQGGIWCIMRIEYRRPDAELEEFGADVFGDEIPARNRSKKKKRGPEDSPFSVVSLTPIQMPNLDLDEMIECRQYFTRDEWLNMLLRSAGYEPNELTERERLHFVERMVPLIEHNYNLCELGPRGTGKSHIYKEVSPYAILLSGGQTTTANLFGRMNSMRADRVGLVGHWDCVTFDEVAGMRFRDTNAVQIMKDYMASGSYARGRDQINADASMVFEGNINDTVQNVLKTTHLFDPFRRSSTTTRRSSTASTTICPGGRSPRYARACLRGTTALLPIACRSFARRCAVATIRILSTASLGSTAISTSVTRLPCARPLAVWLSCCSPTRPWIKTTSSGCSTTRSRVAAA